MDALPSEKYTPRQKKAPAGRRFPPPPAKRRAEVLKPKRPLWTPRLTSALGWWTFGVAYQALCVALIVYFSLKSGEAFVAGWDDPFYGYLSTGQLCAAVAGGVLVFGLLPMTVGVLKNKLRVVARGSDIVGLGCGLLLMAWLVSELLTHLYFRPGNVIGALAITQHKALADVAAPMAANVAIIAAVAGQLVAGTLIYAFCEQRRLRDDSTRHIAGTLAILFVGLAMYTAHAGHLLLFDDYVHGKVAALAK